MSPRQRSSFRPQLEALEERWLPSGLPYPTAASVSQLIADINYADNTGGAFTIELQPSTKFDLTTDLTVGGAKPVDLTIMGNGDTIDSSNQYFRLFNVASTASLTLDHAMLGGGYLWWKDGGGIYNAGGTVTLSYSTLSGATHAGAGGGIYNAGGAVTLNNSALSGCTADAGVGGGIYNDRGSVTINNSSLAGNLSTFSDGIGGAQGGAIYNSGGTVTVNHSTISGNSCSYDPPVSGGGGIFNGGTVTVENFSNITGNTADVGADVFNYGVLYLDSTSTIGELPDNTIPIDSNAPALQIRDATVTEGNTGTVAAQFTMTLSATSTKTITVAYATANGTATAGSDYQAASGTLTFAPGETSKMVTVLVKGDRLGEPNETFFVNLSAATNATILGSRAVGTIIDDEPRVNITDVSKQEGKKGQMTLFTFTVTLSAAYDQAVTMSYRTVGGTAKSDDDYVAKTGTLTFAPGETTKTITIQVKGDSRKEANETFYVDLFGLSSNALFTKNRGIGTILNDD
ncbi:MAG TPA: Calx-beta domain-containing protein [Gemmataceae bacterium]|nr:Calx-beta domain-containing protein [Gemmataceae bacterium]